MKLDQYFTPAWAAELLVRRHFPDLSARDTVVEFTCGDGRFLMAIPPEVDAYGIEIDPKAAAEANAVPMGEEDRCYGASKFNWLSDFKRRLLAEARRLRGEEG